MRGLYYDLIIVVVTVIYRSSQKLSYELDKFQQQEHPCDSLSFALLMPFSMYDRYPASVQVAEMHMRQLYQYSTYSQAIHGIQRWC
jgi:hypothetical protein